jgi:hypothetical protein
MCDERERVRAARAEVARLSASRYRGHTSAEQRAAIEAEITDLVATLPEADQKTWADELDGTSGAPMDWSILDNDQVVTALASAVRSVVQQYGGEKLSATEDDLTQSGRIILAERAVQARKELRMGYGYLQRWIWQRLTDLVKREHRDSSINAMEDVLDGDANESPVWMEQPYHRGRWK